MTSNDIQRQLKLIDASTRIASIYAQYGQLKAAQKELQALGLTLNARRAM